MFLEKATDYHLVYVVICNSLTTISVLNISMKSFSENFQWKYVGLTSCVPTPHHVLILYLIYNPIPHFLSWTERRKKKGIVLIIPILLLAIKVTLSDTYSIKHFTYSPAVSGLQSKTARNMSVVQKVSLYPPHRRMCTLLNPGVSQ